MPSNQWKYELSNWFEASLARLQLGVTEYAVGPTDIVPGMTVINPNSGDLGAAMCKQQLSKNTQGTVSFSVVGIVIIFVVGGAIMILSFILEGTVAWLQDRFKRSSHRRINWVSDSFFQLQRMAYEKSSMGEWDRLHSNVPITKRVETFGGWSDVDPLKPTITHSSTKQMSQASAMQSPITSAHEPETEPKAASKASTWEITRHEV